MSRATVDPGDTLAVLKAAEEWLSDPEHWTQGWYGRNQCNAYVTDPAKAVRTCASGALAYVCGRKLSEHPWHATCALQDALGSPVPEINDCPGGYERIMAGLRKATETLEATP